ncbi:MAG: prolyl-tRNA synthetase [Candidatus Taylorbacteria bacterium RIFCSPHIGHO2_01_FULL_46_22b]|uniref:Proline--tRNA ligase n=1 Tax=Candidatus Taylorbacteria bacterium RIFCSPHIGHO2_01_FULL_46_22b TaxID=1802301 RepID=A0A1G2M3U2_9BACT|nr:MAG: prolyl-tRNA synthetase [Candidatus Taylorbacteria bacterium RIFCSPHIGHO2_01_FULL_46_22b]
MRQTELFSKTRKEVPKDEVSKNAKLLIKAGFIHKEMAGVYSFLPLGLRVLNKVMNVIREEMNASGGQEILLSALQNKEIWESTGRWSDKAVDSWFKTTLGSGGEAGLGFTHEEPITQMMRDHIRSFRDLPVYAYQIQTKFRNETRAKSGLIRTREFLMKDLYSFSRTAQEHDEFYKIMQTAYTNVFSRVGLGPFTHMTYASGGSFSKYSHEFQTVCDAGEDTIHLCEKCSIAVNDEIFSDQPVCPACGNKNLSVKKSVEVGNIFSLGTRFSEALGLKFVDEKNESKLVIMGSYGIGPARLIGTIVESFSDEKSILWPSAVAPFSVHLLLLDPSDDMARKQAETVYNALSAGNIEVLFDDRDVRAGEKFADADLIGVSLRVIASSRTTKDGTVEVLDRRSGKHTMVSPDTLASHINAHL